MPVSTSGSSSGNVVADERDTAVEPTFWLLVESTLLEPSAVQAVRDVVAGSDHGGLLTSAGPYHCGHDAFGPFCHLSKCCGKLGSFRRWLPLPLGIEIKPCLGRGPPSRQPAEDVRLPWPLPERRSGAPSAGHRRILAGERFHPTRSGARKVR